MPGPLSDTVTGEPRRWRGRAVFRRRSSALRRSAAADAVAAAERLDGVVDQVDHHASDLLDVEAHWRQPVGEPLLDPNLPKEAVVERERLVEHAVQIRRDGAGRRHARKLRELVHQRLERLDFADDRGGAFLDERARPAARR